MGLFDRIKKSLFGSKDDEQQEEKKAQEVEKESSDDEKVAKETSGNDEVIENAKSSKDDNENIISKNNDGTDAQESPLKDDEENNKKDASEENTSEQKNEKEIVPGENIKEKISENEKATEELYEKGLEKSNKGFGSRLNAFLAKFRTVDEDFFDDLEELLIESDVGYETAEDLTDQLREEAKLQKAKTRDDLKKVIVQKLVEVYDENSQDKNEKLTYNPENKPNVYLFVGVNGAGKTTTVGKLAKRYHDEGKKVIMVAADTFRAGAVEQLVEWGKRVDVPVVTGPAQADPAAVVYDGVEKAIKEQADYLLVDTAGRLQNKVNLMNELEKIQRTIKKQLPDQPAETLLVLDGSTGQNALLQAKDFDKTTKLSGLVLTKLDGSSKGGVVLAIRHEMKLPVKLVGLGEKPEDLADFDAANYAVGLFHDLL